VKALTSVESNVFVVKYVLKKTGITKLRQCLECISSEIAVLIII
jgi:hypothetical protein